MRPLSLTIEGLTAFRSQQEIDLSELDLFVITGPTGAGKSSILDAITFALYGNIARVSGNELRDLISHGSSSMRVRLDFQVDGQRYRVARRMSKTAHGATLERVDGDTVSPDGERGGVRHVNRRLEEIVGLDFKAFTKAVLLPQGAFHEFLTGDVAERRRILMRLLDLERYELVGQAARREATRLDAIVGERRSLIESNYRDATDERLAELTSALGVARNHSTKVEAARDEAKAKADEVAELQRTRDSLADRAAKLGRALDSLASLAAGWDALDAAEQTARAALTASEKALRGAVKAREQADKALERIVARNGDAATLATAAAAEKTRTESFAELEKLTAELTAAEEAARTLAAALEKARVAETDARTAFERHRRRREAAEAARAKAEAVSRWAAASAAAERLEGELVAARDGAAVAHAALAEARSQEHHLHLQHSALVIRATLVPGDRCPVCEAIVDDLPTHLHSDGAEASLDSAAAARARAETAEKAARKAVVALETQQTAAAVELRRARKVVPKGETLPAADAAEAALAEAVSALAVIAAAETAASTALEKAVAAAAKAETASSTATAKAEAAAKGRDGAQSRLDSALASLRATLGAKLPAHPAVEIARRRAELTAAETACASAAEKETFARGARDAAREAHAATAEDIAGFDRDLAAARTAAGIACEAVAGLLADAKLPAAPATDLPRAEAVVAWRKSCARHAAVARQSHARLERQVEAATRGLVGSAKKSGIELEEQTVRAIVQRFDEAVTDARGAVVAAEKDVEATKKRIEEREQIEREISHDRRLGELHDALAHELRADRFVAFVLEESMVGLASYASDELREISNGRYSLAASQGSFEVVDHHNADERRSVATLSGGETFLASLSLALALSAGLRELAGAAAARLDAIFIDEGFGALDPETLDVVVDTLERLRESDRMVGAITHIAALADRIPSGLLVEKQGSSSHVLTR
jgi:DNA repair protein SbcC/Rad50